MRPIFDVVYEDNHLLIVNKPAGLLVQGDQTGDETLADHAKAYIKQKYDKPGDVFLGIVHRLDRPVSGLVVLARTSKALERMNRLFKERKISKVYWAITNNKPLKVADELTHWLQKNTKTNKVTASTKASTQGQKAVLSYKLIGRITDHYLLEVNPVTGRPHQIRAQLAKIGCPIIGDVKYGYTLPNKNLSIYLHARRLSFEHPVKKQWIELEADVPRDSIWRLFTQ